MKSSHIDARMTDAVLKVIDLLVANDIRGLVRLAGGTRFSTEEDILGLERELGLYGCTLVRPPPDAFKHMSVIEVANAYPRKWAITMPLWTSEEGLSDLSLELTLIARDDGFEIELDNVHVL